MNILVVHNYYQQPGGEDQVFADEVAMLRANGNHVTVFNVHNDAVAGLGKLTLARKTLWNDDAYERIAEICRKEQIEIAHFHNTFPLISPAAYYAARDSGARVVQTLHNFRLLCPAATFFRDGHVCEECLCKSVPWPAVVHACYRDSRSASAVTAGMLSYHRAKGTWRDAVDVYIALTEFSKRKFIQGGLPEQKIVVKPNFVAPDPGQGPGGGGYAVFIGRLSPEKGISTLLEAWTKHLGGRIPLKILGDGPMRTGLSDKVVIDAGVDWLGRRAMVEVYNVLGRAEALIFPSLWYEGLPRTIIESFASGTPVIASNLGSMAELVRDGKTGRLFEAGNSAQLAHHVEETFGQRALLSDLRTGAREEFLRTYTADRNYPMLIKAYEHALAAAR
ncbi:MAG: glycosyltransferase [Anaerolineae bacterium]|nr:glycosyltransferase [Phycisphaerae bacterium]